MGRKYGSVPKIVEKEMENGVVEICGEEAFVTPVLYFESEVDENGKSLIGFYPLDAYWDGKTFQGMPEPPDTADRLAESFNKGYHSGGYPEPLPFDRGHATQEEGTEPVAPAYIIEAIATSIPVRTFDSETGQPVKRTPPSGTRTFAGRIAVLRKGEAELAGRQLPHVSITYKNNNGQYVLKNPAFVLNPASNFLPPLVFARHFTDNGGTITKSDKGGNIVKERNVKKMDSASPTYQPLLIELQNVFGQDSVVPQDLVNYLTEEEGKMFLTKLTGGGGEQQAQGSENQPKSDNTPLTRADLDKAIAEALTKSKAEKSEKTEESKTKNEEKKDIEKKDETKKEEPKATEPKPGTRGAIKALHSMGKTAEEINEIMKKEQQFTDLMTEDEATASMTKRYGTDGQFIQKSDKHNNNKPETLSGQLGLRSGVISVKK